MSESFTSLRAIILRRSAAGDDSLALQTLLENGQFQWFRIPGVLKSNKRSSFHYYPGAVYRMIFRAAADTRVIPRSSELVFSPFSENQSYVLLNAVAELIRAAEFLKASPENAEYFELLLAALTAMPVGAAAVEAHVDAHYWQLLHFLGLAAVAEEDGEYVAYDLQSGFITARERAARAHSDFLLPVEWIKRAEGEILDGVDSAHCRELIRKFLSTI